MASSVATLLSSFGNSVQHILEWRDENEKETNLIALVTKASLRAKPYYLMNYGDTQGLENRNNVIRLTN